ncbi:hypothetical protein [Bombiscardovia coagulans]|nr:hypothetical protein [Bombiscardovia coagulans]
MKQFECVFPAQVKDRQGNNIIFDPANNASHRRLLDHKIKEFKTGNPDAADAVLDFIDQDRHVAVLVDRSVSSVEGSGNRREIRLSASQSTPSAGAKVQAMYEQKYPGFKLTQFHPYEGRAVIEKLSPAQSTARGLLANALNIDPWQVSVKETLEGGWECVLDHTIIYTPSKYDEKVQEACQQIGHLGWWFEANAKTGVIIIHPGEPASFQPAHEYPLSQLGTAQQQALTPFGVLLPQAGGLEYKPAVIDWQESSFLLLGGEGGTGKTVALNAILAGLIAQHVDLSVIDLDNKSTDFYWLRPWVTPHHWGCESIVQAAGVLNLLVEEIEHGERAKVWKENGWQSWYMIPDWAKQQYPIHVVVIDEFSSLVDTASVCKSIPNSEKTPPAVIEQTFTGQAEYDIKTKTLRLLRTARAQGYRLILASQTVNDRSGLGPTTRDLFGHRIVMGPNPSDSLVNGVFHDPKHMPNVPANILDEGVSKGVGRAELAGERGQVFKTYWAGTNTQSDTEIYGRTLTNLIGLPEDINETRYLDTLRHHGPDNPPDGEYMRYLTERISLPYEQALASDGILALLREALYESQTTFSANSSTSENDTSNHENDSVPVQDAGSGAQLMDAEQLAKLLSQG